MVVGDSGREELGNLCTVVVSVMGMTAGRMQQAIRVIDLDIH
jgi:hypothetical protein